MDIQQYFYPIGTTLLLPLWIYMFLKKDKRKDMLLLGLFFGISAFVIGAIGLDLDYWRHTYILGGIPLEDFYYGFIFGGISTELSEIILNKRNSNKIIYRTHKELILLFGIILILSLLILVVYLKINSIVAGIITLLLIGIISILIRPRILKLAIISAIALAIITFIMFQILLLFYPEMFINHWQLNNLSGSLFLSIPIEELIFSFILGFSASNLYEIMFGYKVVDNKAKG